MITICQKEVHQGGWELEHMPYEDKVKELFALVRLPLSLRTYVVDIE